MIPKPGRRLTFPERLAAARANEDGATLILALIFITIIAVTITALLSLASANIRATVELRKQAAEAAGAEAAAQIAIDKMRHSGYLSGSACFDGASTLTLDNAAQYPDGSALPAVVQCSPDDTASFVSSFTRPGYALLGLAANGGSEAGIDIQVEGTGKVHIGGNAATQSFLNLKGDLTVDGNFLARTSTTDCTGSANSSVTVGAGKTKTCNAAAIPDITVYNPPALPDNYPVYTSANTTVTCGKKITFQPGIYPDLTLLTPAFNCNQALVYDFRPGVYYFNYTGLWDIDQGTVIGGKDTAIPTPNNANDVPAIPGACPNLTGTGSPVNPNPGAGVTFVFGGQSQWTVSQKGQVELCGRWQEKTMPPVALYGLSGPVSNNTGQTVPALTGCLTSTDKTIRCALFETAEHSKQIAIYLQGMAYAPSAWFDLDERGSTLQYFNDGLIARAVNVFAPASATVPTPFANLPVSLPGLSWSIVNLTVSVCPGKTTCTPTTGTVRLRAKIGILDPTGIPATNGTRQAKIYTWSVQR
jgi:hypothetical protein